MQCCRIKRYLPSTSVLILLGVAMYQLSSFDYGQIKAHMHHGLGASAIAGIMVKADGKSHWSDTAISDAMQKLRDDAGFKGQRQPGSGAPRKTTAALDKRIIKFVFAKRGRRKVTVDIIRKHFPSLVKLGRSLVEDRLDKAGLAWMRRRRKTLVTSKYIPERLEYCRGVKRKHQETLNRWCYGDGTVFYLDRTEDENEHTQRAALGHSVWRMADCSDALYADCVGPSSYKKAQGLPVRVWGLLADGHLWIYILPEGECMNTDNYVWLIESHFEKWMGSCTHLVQDFERCLRAKESLRALDEVGLELVADYPRVSQDFNAIENAWKLLRQRLDVTLPRGMEARGDFITRVRAAVAWLNRNRGETLLELSRNQKERAQECLDLEGARTHW